MLVNRDGRLTNSDEVYDTRGHQNWQTNLQVRLAKEVAVEKWKFHLLDAVGPAPACHIKRKERLNTLGFKRFRYLLFVAGTNSNCVPRKVVLHVQASYRQKSHIQRC